MNTVGNSTYHRKSIKGFINLRISIPAIYEVDAIYETYLDKKGKPYQEEEWECGVDEVLEQFPNVQQTIKELKEKGYTIDEIEIE